MDKQITRLAPNANIIDLSDIHFDAERIKDLPGKFKKEGYFIGRLIAGTDADGSCEKLNVGLALSEIFHSNSKTYKISNEITDYKVNSDYSSKHYTDTYEDSITTDNIKRNDEMYVLVNKSNEIVGGIYFENNNQGFGYIEFLTVQKNLPAGAGTLLLNLALQHLQTICVKTVSLETNSAANFYKKNGFEIKHKLYDWATGSFDKNPHNMIVMIKTLKPVITQATQTDLKQ